MTIKDRRIIFFGTPEFAAYSLKHLLADGFNIVAVVTAPDKQAGRGMKFQESAVKQAALENGIQVLQPMKLKDPSFIETLLNLKPDIQIIIAFRMLPEVVWNLPKLGTINLHASLLPDYRGAAPINWAIIKGESETGITTFRLKHEIDSGDILLQQKITIPPDMDAGSLHDVLMHEGAILMSKTIKEIFDETIKPIEQTHQSTKTAPKIFTEDCKINWNAKASDINNHIRGLSPYPGAYTLLHGQIFKIFKSTISLEKHNFEPGLLCSDGKSTLKYSCIDGFIHLEIIQLAGKKRMQVADFLKGNKISIDYLI
jgi:methionyl-tRNA formyltransferase